MACLWIFNIRHQDFNIIHRIREVARRVQAQSADDFGHFESQDLCKNALERDMEHLTAS